MIAAVIHRACLGSWLARCCSAWLLLIVGAALIGPALCPWDPTAIDWDALVAPPDARHWFGTDLVGRDLFARVLLGAQVSLGVALIAVC